MSNHPIIKALQEKVAKERNQLSLLELGDHCFPFLRGHEAATAFWLPLIEMAVEMAEFVNKNTSFCADHIRKPYIPCRNPRECESKMKAKHFLLSIRETVADATTLADAKKDSK